MGPNGSGKSTFASVIAGSPRFEVTAGTAEYDGKNLLEMNIEERARAGIFLGFQYPVEIPGVSMANFMKLAVARRREYLGLPPLSSGEFLKLMREKGKVVELDSKLTGRAVNEGFSGGEKKKNEIFQMAMLEPELADTGRDGQRARHRRAPHRGAGGEQAAHAPERHRRDNALPTAARLHRARFRACAL